MLDFSDHIIAGILILTSAADDINHRGRDYSGMFIYTTYILVWEGFWVQTPGQKALSNWKLVDLKMLDFSDFTRTAS